MAKKKELNYSEIDDIRDDLDSLKTNVVELTRHLQKDSGKHIETTKDMLMDRYEEYRDVGRKQMKNVERRVKAKPTQAIAIAFATGLCASFLLRGRR